MTWMQASGFGEMRCAELDEQNRPVRIIIRRDLILNFGEVVRAKITAYHPTLHGYFADTEKGIVFLPTSQALVEGQSVWVKITKEPRLDKEATGKIVEKEAVGEPFPQVEEISDSAMDELVAEAMESQVLFGKGAQLHIERTRACWTIDVDSGKSDLPLLEINRLAMVEIRRQITLKNMGGIILIDFAGSKRGAVRQVVKEATFDSLTQVLGWTKAGLLELERRRERASLWDSCAENNPVAVYYRVRRALAQRINGEVYVAPEVLKIMTKCGVSGRPIFDKPISYFEIREKKK